MGIMSTIDRHCRLAALAASLLAMAAMLGCGGGPRQDPVPYQLALRWNDVLTVEVVDTWDLMKHHTDTVPQVTHVIEVVIQEGPPKYQGKTFTLPYDEWATGKQPPPKGSVQVMTAASWVKPRPESRGAPHPDWQR